MEKKKRSKKALLSFLSKTASVAFSNPPFSPRHDNNSSRLKGHTGKGFSGPIISMVPAEARRKLKNGSFHSQEPTSPKVSCIGQIIHKKKICQPKCVSMPPMQDRKKGALSGVFHGTKGGRRKSDSVADRVVGSDRAPSLGQMKRFASGGEAFKNFKWEDGGEDGCWDEDETRESDEEEFRVPCSAPLVGGGGGVVVEPKAEVNLWRRRSMDPPMPLQLNPKKNVIS